MGWDLDSPVTLFVYNRPEKTRETMNQVAQLEPSTMLIVADGPRPSVPDDSKRVDRTREVVEEGIDWDCNLLRNYAKENLGIHDRFVSGLEWVFDRVPESIILEDDCVPSQSFFRFCDVMLDRFRDDERVMDITGHNVIGEWKSDRQDYHFSNYGSIWGWATWRRAWELYDPEMNSWRENEVRERLRDVIADKRQANYLEYLYDKVSEGEIETWDYQWRFSRQINSAYSIVSSKNLVTNIGFDDEATHTRDSNSAFGGNPRYELDFPLRINEFVAVDRGYDAEFYKSRPVSMRYAPLRLARELYSNVLGR